MEVRKLNTPKVMLQTLAFMAPDYFACERFLKSNVKKITERQ